MSWFAALQTLFLLYATSKIATTVATNGLRGIHYIVSGHGCIRSGNGRVPQLNPSSGPAILRLSVAGSPVVLNEMTELRHFFHFLSDFDTQLTRQSRSFIFDWTISQNNFFSHSVVISFVKSAKVNFSNFSVSVKSENKNSWGSWKIFILKTESIFQSFFPVIFFQIWLTFSLDFSLVKIIKRCTCIRISNVWLNWYLYSNTCIKGPGPGLGVLVWLRTRVIVLSQIIG